MNSELQRIQSYQHVIHISRCVQSLARDGFYFDQQRNSLVCFSCNLSFDYTLAAELSTLHRHQSPNCPFLNRDNKENIELKLLPLIKMNNEVPRTKSLEDLDDLDCRHNTCNGPQSLTINRMAQSTGDTLNIAREDGGILAVYRQAVERARRRGVLEENGVAFRNPYTGTAGSYNSAAALCQEEDSLNPTIGNHYSPAATHHQEEMLVEQDKLLVLKEKEQDKQMDKRPTSALFELQAQSGPNIGAPVSFQALNFNRSQPDYNLLKQEIVRLSTYYDWPMTTPVCKEDLARAGFFYTGGTDRVRCAFCREHLRNWAVGDVPTAEHARHFPDCPFVRGENVGNIPLGTSHSSTSSATSLHKEYDQRTNSIGNQSAAQNVQDSALWISDNSEETGLYLTGSDSEDEDVVLGGQQARTPAYANEMKRVESFIGKPVAAGKTPQILAEAGFYYSGPYDNVRCFFCDGGLKNWQPEDDAWTEHARWFPKCQYVQKHKTAEFIGGCQIPRTLSLRQNFPDGQYISNPPPTVAEQYVSTVPVQTAAAVKPMPVPAVPLPEPYAFDRREIRARMDSPNVRSLIAMGYRENIIRTTLERHIAATGDDFINTESLLEAVMEMEEEMAAAQREVDIQTTRDVSAPPNTSSIAHNNNSPANTPAAAAPEARLQPFPEPAPGTKHRTFAGLTEVARAEAVNVETGLASVSKPQLVTAAAAAQPAVSSASATTPQSNAPTSTGVTVASVRPAAESSKSKKKKKKKSVPTGGAASAAVAGVAAAVAGGATASAAKSSMPAQARNVPDKKASSSEATKKEEDERLRSSEGNDNNLLGSELLTNEAQSLLEENRQLKEQRTCRICMDKDVNTVFLPCGHLVCCQDCAQEMRTCPICRTLVRGTVKTFMS